MKSTLRNYKNLLMGLFIGVVIAFIGGLTTLTIFHNQTTSSQDKKITKASGVSPLRARITALQTTSSGTATLSSYVTGTNKQIKYITKGGWCFVEGKGLIMKKGTTTGNHSFQVASGLPHPASSNGVYIVPTGYAGTYTKQVNEYGRYLFISSSGVMTLYTNGTLATEHYFSAAYPIAAS